MQALQHTDAIISANNFMFWKIKFIHSHSIQYDYTGAHLDRSKHGRFNYKSIQCQSQGW